MAKDSKSVYDESKIKTLSSLEHIRLRSGMYIGKLGNGKDNNDGIYILIKEVVDNSIDEYIMGYGKKILISIKDKKVFVRDFGRGIPLGKIVECVSVINTGAKYNDDVFQFSVGLNGVGTKAVNALSSHFRVVSFRDGKYSEAVFSQGKLLKEKSGATKEETGTYIEFEPDESIFGEYNFYLDILEDRIKHYSYLNSGLELVLNDKSFSSKNGLLDLLNEDVKDTAIYEPIYFKGEKLEFSFTHTKNYGENFYSFVNGQNTNDGGTHESAFKEGISKGINEFFKKTFSGVDIRDGIIGAIAIKIKDPIFESQTKNKLGNTNIRMWIVQDVKSAIVDYLYKNVELSKQLLNKIVANENLRKELSVVKKEARDLEKKSALNIEKLRDCKFHYNKSDPRGEKSMIFITEGDSASGSITSSRDPYTQAVFSLRGKPQNVFGQKKTEIYKNKELFNVMKALGIENSVEELRYNKVIIATDADDDGFHIRNLVLTFILSYFEDLVHKGHIYILETPLFRVRDKNQSIYCYSEKERDIAIEKLKNSEVTRFKGLGEISPKEFKQFIGDDIRLLKVDIKNSADIEPTLEFYMGKNTPSRRQYIMENLR